MDKLTAKIKILEAVGGDLGLFNEACGLMQEELDAAPLCDNATKDAMGFIKDLLGTIPDFKENKPPMYGTCFDGECPVKTQEDNEE